MDNEKLAQIAKFARLQAGFKTEKAAAEAIGCSRPLVISWEKGDGTIKGSKYQMAAAIAYKVRPLWLTDGIGEHGYPFDLETVMDRLRDASLPSTAEGRAVQLRSYLDLPDIPPSSVSEDSPEALKSKAMLWDVFGESRPETRPGYVRLGLLEGFAGMGRGDYVGDYPEIVDFVEVTREWVEQKLRGIPIDAIRVITGRGQSMKGMYENGDLVFVDSRVKSFIDDAAYVFRRGGRVQIKRLQWRGEKVRILSANSAYEPEDVSLDELEIGGLALAAWTLKEF